MARQMDPALSRLSDHRAHTGISQEGTAMTNIQLVENIKHTVQHALAAAEDVKRDNHRLRMALIEAKLAIEYLHEQPRPGPTGATNTALARIEAVLAVTD
jgi:hypothetical protein